jgi:ribosomal protein L11 methyltransferase
LFSVRVKLPADTGEGEARKISDSLSEQGHPVVVARESVKQDASWILEWFLPEAPEKNSLIKKLNLDVAANAVTIQKVDTDADWLSKSYQQFPPFSVGPFFIHGSHFDGKVPDGQFGLQVDAATAFGSGEHGTTKGCLLAMTDLKDSGACPWNVLDMGTGSGILGLAAWKLWKTPVLAVDNDPECVRVTEHHRSINKVPAGDFTSVTGDGFNTEIVTEKKPFDLIIANILAAPLKEMAPDLMAVSDENGYVILSGLLTEQADDVLSAYRNFTLKKRYDVGEWTTLLLQNAAA